MQIGIVFVIRLSFLFWIFEAGAGSPCLCGDASTVASTLLRPHCSTPSTGQGAVLSGNRCVGTTPPSRCDGWAGTTSKWLRRTVQKVSHSNRAAAPALPCSPAGGVEDFICKAGYAAHVLLGA